MPGDGGSPYVVYYAGSEAKCSPTGGGWFYDDPVYPKLIVICDATCAAITGETVSAVTGCRTLSP